jgi:hypothetical protein
MTRRRMNLGFIATTLMVAGAGAFSVAPAHASNLRASQVTRTSATPASSTGNICLKNKPKWCIKSNGTSRQVTLTDNQSDYASFTAFNKKPDGGVAVTFEFKNGNGNCLRAGSDTTVKIEDGACDPNDGQDRWYEGTPTSSLVNFTIENFMGTKGWGLGYKVWTTSDTGDGWWTNWTFPTP